MTRPEVSLDYGAAQLRLRLRSHPSFRPARSTDEAIFDEPGFWNGRQSYRTSSRPSNRAGAGHGDVGRDGVYRSRDRALILLGKRGVSCRTRTRGEDSKPKICCCRSTTSRFAEQSSGLSPGILGDDMGLGKARRRWPRSSRWLANARPQGAHRRAGLREVPVEGRFASSPKRSVQVIEGSRKLRGSIHTGCLYRLVNYEQVVRDLDPDERLGLDVSF